MARRVRATQVVLRFSHHSKLVMVRFMRATHFALLCKLKLGGPDEPGHDGI
jgi:hypothetical protein